MTYFEQLIDNLTKVVQNHNHDGSMVKVYLAKVTLKGLDPFFGVISVIFLSISNAQLNEALRTLYLGIAILFISMSLLWSAWKNKHTTTQMIQSIKEKLKHGKNIKPPSPNGGTDPAHIVQE